MNDYGSTENKGVGNSSPSADSLKDEKNLIQELRVDGEENKKAGAENGQAEENCECDPVENMDQCCSEGGAQSGAESDGASRKCSENYPLHWLVWHNNYRKLDKELTDGKVVF